MCLVLYLKSTYLDTRVVFLNNKPPESKCLRTMCVTSQSSVVSGFCLRDSSLDSWWLSDQSGLILQHFTGQVARCMLLAVRGRKAEAGIVAVLGWL